jgi:hypothetical protein
VRPVWLDEVLSVGARLSYEFDLIRIDFLISKTGVFVGEITNCHWGGNDRFGGFENEVTLSAYIFASESDSHVPRGAR